MFSALQETNTELYLLMIILKFKHERKGHLLFHRYYFMQWFSMVINSEHITLWCKSCGFDHQKAKININHCTIFLVTLHKGYEEPEKEESGVKGSDIFYIAAVGDWLEWGEQML
jgi:hypothetical protein